MPALNKQHVDISDIVLETSDADLKVINDFYDKVALKALNDQYDDDPVITIDQLEGKALVKPVVEEPVIEEPTPEPPAAESEPQV